jgi:hypothetical protein
MKIHLLLLVALAIISANCHAGFFGGGSKMNPFRCFYHKPEKLCSAILSHSFYEKGTEVIIQATGPEAWVKKVVAACSSVKSLPVGEKVIPSMSSTQQCKVAAGVIGSFLVITALLWLVAKLQNRTASTKKQSI